MSGLRTRPTALSRCDMKKLPVDIGEIAGMIDSEFHEDGYYLDLQTGKVVIVPSELLYREFEDADDPLDLPEWEKELVPLAKEVQAGSDRYKPLPEADSRESYHDMELFTGTVDDPSLRERLEDALDGRGAFSRFRRVLDHHDVERERWYKFKDEAMARRVRDWLRDLDIEPLD